MVPWQQFVTLLQSLINFNYLSTKITDNDVFERNGKKVIVSALKNLFTTPPITLQKASDPFKIMTSLLDKQELGENIIDNVLPYIFYSVHKFKDGFPFSREVCFFLIIT